MAFSSFLGCCGNARDSRLESNEVRATWRALLPWEPVILREMVGFGCSIPMAEELCAMCDLRMLQVMSSGTSSEELIKNISLEFLRQGGLVYLFLEDWELAWVALRCHLTSDFLVSRNARGLVAVVLPWLPTVAVFESPSRLGRAAGCDGSTTRCEFA